MKAKLLSIIILIVLFYILPLIFTLELVFTPQILFLSFTLVVLFMTQPALTIEEGKKNVQKDRNSIWLIMAMVALIQVTIVVEWAYFRRNFILFEIDALTILGVGLLVFGTLFRIWCINALGKYFTATVRVQEGQKIVTNSAYKYIRHPSYLGAYLAIVGSAIFMHAYFGIFFSIVGMLFAYAYRITFEEKALVEEFGNEYLEYQKRTNKMIPFVF